MAFNKLPHLKAYLEQLRDHGRAALESYEEEFNLHKSWANEALEEVRNGKIDTCRLVNKTPGKKKERLKPLNEINLEDEHPIQCSTAVKVVKRGRPKKGTTKPKDISVSVKEEEVDIILNTSPIPPQKRQSEELIESTSKRICAGKKISRDSGLSTGSQSINDKTYAIKEEKHSPSNSTCELSGPPHSKVKNTTCHEASEKLSEHTPKSTRQSSFKLGIGTVKHEPVSPRSSIYVTPSNMDIMNTEEEQKPVQVEGSSLPPKKINFTNLPGQEQPKGTSPVSKLPVRVSRPKSRSLVKLSSEHDRISTKDDNSSTMAAQQVASSNTTIDDDSSNHIQNKETPVRSNSYLLKPFASASRIPQLFFKAASPFVNRIAPLTPSFQRSNSFAASSSSKLITEVQSFLPKPANGHEKKSFNREEDLQNLMSKTEAALRKKEEAMKARMEEKIRIREEKRLKVIAQREAKEREKLENQLKLEQMKEARQKQIQAEREEKIRQDNLRKKLLAEKKAAETEERRRQEEEAKIAKFKQQEEELKRAAALRRQEQEEALKKLKERQLYENEAAAHWAKEAEVHAKQGASKSQPHPQTVQNQNNYSIAEAGPDDSSDDDDKPKKSVPLWAQSKQRAPKLLEDHNISQTQIFVFFGSKKSTPDLGKIFIDIDRRRLLRKSSAVWRTPPKDKL